MKATTRTFVAVETGLAVRNRAQQLIEALQAAAADVKWVEPHNLHLTLRFLGDVPTTELGRVGEEVARAAAQQRPFEMALRGAGAFPNARRPRTIWLGSGSGEEAMRALAEQIDRGLAKLGYRREDRPFRTHLTIGRVRSGGPAMAELGRLLQQHADFDAGRMTVAEVVVFSSQLTPKGPIYDALSRAKLGG